MGDNADMFMDYGSGQNTSSSSGLLTKNDYFLGAGQLDDPLATNGDDFDLMKYALEDKPHLNDSMEQLLSQPEAQQVGN